MRVLPFCRLVRSPVAPRLSATRAAPVRGKVRAVAGSKKGTREGETGQGRVMQMKVRKFSMTQIKPHRISLLIGRRGSGKSVLLRDLLYNLRDRFDYAMAMCPTMEITKLVGAADKRHDTGAQSPGSATQTTGADRSRDLICG